MLINLITRSRDVSCSRWFQHTKECFETRKGNRLYLQVAARKPTIRNI